MKHQQSTKPASKKRGLKSETSQPRFLVIGQMARPHGVRGELRADIHTALPERFTWLEKVFLALDEQEPEPEPYEVEAVRFHQGQVLIKLATVDDRDEAETLRRYWLMVPEEEAIPLAEGEYFLYQLIGLAVYSDEDAHLGELVEVIETGANNVFVVRGPEREILIPDTAEVVKEIDFDRGRVTVHLIPGL